MTDVKLKISTHVEALKRLGYPLTAFALETFARKIEAGVPLGAKAPANMGALEADAAKLITDLRQHRRLRGAAMKVLEKPRDYQGVETELGEALDGD